MTSLSKYLMAALWLLVVCSSCQPSKKLHQDRLYLQGIDTALVTTIKIPDPVIQKGELLSITVFSDDKDATSFYNQAQSSASAIITSSTDVWAWYMRRA